MHFSRKCMKVNLPIGPASVLPTGVMTAGTAQAGWPQLTTSCNDTNQGTTTAVEQRSRWHE
jgi:hypothetical protein